jgi:hypothetical protein
MLFPGIRREIGGSLSSCRFPIDIQRPPPFRFLGTIAPEGSRSRVTVRRVS